MGQKTHPFGLRVGFIKNWRSRWYARRRGEYLQQLQEDLKIRDYIKVNWKHAGISDIEIERSAKRVRITIHTARPGVIIGRRGAEIDRMRDDIGDLTPSEVFIDIKEVKVPQIDAQLVAENIALQLEKRVSFRRAMKRAIQLAIGHGAQGIRLSCKGRLGGAEIAREEGYKEGKVPLNTFRADIDYGFAEAFTTYGTIGVKVWIYKGEVLVKKAEAERMQEIEKKEKELEKETLHGAELSPKKPKAAKEPPVGAPKPEDSQEHSAELPGSPEGVKESEARGEKED